MGFPKSARRRAADALLQILQSDPALRAGVRTWRVNEGRPDDKTPKTPATYPLLVWLPLEAAQGPTRLDDTCGTREAEAAFDFELYCLGTDQREVMDFSGALEAALFPADGARRAAVQAILDASPILDGTVRVRGASGRQEAGPGLVWGAGSVGCTLQL